MSTEHSPAEISLTALRGVLGDVVNRAAIAKERTTITRHGKPLAAVISYEDLELLEQIEDRADIEALDRARVADAHADRMTFDAFLGVNPA